MNFHEITDLRLLPSPFLDVSKIPSQKVCLPYLVFCKAHSLNIFVLLYRGKSLETLAPLCSLLTYYIFAVIPAKYKSSYGDSEQG